VKLFERGYEKDPANVATEAIKAAQREGKDVVLVDTAGRMQDNEPLMRALSKLINNNDPDLVLFVGEGDRSCTRNSQAAGHCLHILLCVLFLYQTRIRMKPANPLTNNTISRGAPRRAPRTMEFTRQ
jgi:GTPase Era involved in 16S rRNA processing